MSELRPQIFLGDFARALDELRPAGVDAKATRLAVARLLGLEPEEAPRPSEPEAQGAAVGVPTPAASSTAPSDRKEKPDEPLPSQPEPELPHEDAAWVPSTIETQSTETTRPSLEALLGQIEALPPADEKWPAPPLDPLFAPGWTRGILVALLATCRDGDVDLDQLIDALARLQRLEKLPRLPWPTLRRGVHVLLDTGPSLTPFAEDQRGLLRQIRLVVGADKTHASKFVGCPSRGIRRGLEAAVWRSPPPGTPVLLLTDLGAAHRDWPLESASEAEWIEFAARVRRAGCPLAALAPVPSARFSAALHRACVIVEWDRRTTAGRLRRRIGRAHPVA